MFFFKLKLDVYILNEMIIWTLYDLIYLSIYNFFQLLK